MVSIPDKIPFTTPPTDIVATELLVDDQVPPDVASVKVAEEPSQMLFIPMIVAGNGLIVISAIAIHPVASE